MDARITQPAIAVPAAMAALQSLGAAIAETGISPSLAALVNMRVSQINGCAVCIEGHAREWRALGEDDDRLILLAAWRETPNFTPSERAALELAEAATRLADRTDPVPDAVWDDAARHFDEQQLAALVLQIANINVWNRLNVATRQMAGMHVW